MRSPDGCGGVHFQGYAPRATVIHSEAEFGPGGRYQGCNLFKDGTQDAEVWQQSAHSLLNRWCTSQWAP
eukprot:12935830-Prorocentrum_lima.AAC.1